MKLSELTLPAYAQMLEALSGQLVKAREERESAGGSADDLLSARLAPDMFPLASQVQFVCIQSEELMARLAGDKAPSVEPPQTLAEALDLLKTTITRLKENAAEDHETDEHAPLELALPQGLIFDFDLAEYVRSWSQPQFYFHLVTAYAILRKEGVGLGKPDYVPHMFQFLRKDAN